MSIRDPDSESQKLFELHIKNLLDAIELCLQKDLVLPTMILIYAGIDAMSWLSMPDGQTEVKDVDFVNWAESYLLPGRYPIIVCNGWDLYGARCALLHSHTAKSRKSVSGVAAEIFYEDDAGNVYVDLMLNSPKAVVAVNVRILGEAFHQAIERFRRKLVQEPKLAQRVYKRARHWFYKGRYADRQSG